MLNAKNLSALLAKNVNEIYPRMFVMSTNGTLLAYSSPDNIKELRDQAAVTSMAWIDFVSRAKQKQKSDQASTTASDSTTVATGDLEVLTVQHTYGNVLARLVQPNMIFVLLGDLPEGTAQDHKITPECRGDPRYPPAVLPSNPSNDKESNDNAPDEPEGASSETSQQPDWVETLLSKGDDELTDMEKDAKIGLLHVQRKKLDAMVDHLRDEFRKSNFSMPDEPSFR